MRKQWRFAVLIGVLTTTATIMRTELLAQTSGETERNRALVTKHLALMNQGQWKEAAELFSTDVRHHLGTWQSGRERTVTGQETLTANLEDIFRTFPDWKMEIVDMVADGGSVVVRCRVSGTHKGVAARRVNGGFLLGAQPTGKRFEVQHIHWYKARDGKITDHFTNRDDLGMTQQLGFLPYPPPSASAGK
jgi:steroid delta-isomerase-like uncharacterized protein